MPSLTIRFTPEFIKACEEIWRDGYNKGINGEDDYPDFKAFFSSIAPKPKGADTYEELEKLPFNPSKCEARIEKFGFAIQCSCSISQGNPLCKTHQNILDRLPPGKDIPYGRFNKPRPDFTLDQGNPIKWGPKKVRSKNKDNNTQPKPKMGEMRDYLSSRIPASDYRTLKKKELTELFFKVKEKENTSSDEEEQSSSLDNSLKTNENSQQQPEQPEQQPQQPEQQSRGQTEQQREEITEEQQTEQQTEEQREEITEEQQTEQQTEQPEDDGKGTGLNLEPVKPKTITEFKSLFNELGIDYSELKGKRAYAQAYENFLREKEEEKTKPMSDEEDEDDEDELKEDNHSYDEISWDGVDYLEDEDTGFIFNLEGKKVAKWNEDADDFIWLSEEAKTIHENARP